MIIINGQFPFNFKLLGLEPHTQHHMELPIPIWQWPCVSTQFKLTSHFPNAGCSPPPPSQPAGSVFPSHTSADCHRRSAAAAIQPSKTNTESSVTSRTRFIYSDIRIAERHNSAPLGVFLSFSFFFALTQVFHAKLLYKNTHTQNKEKKCVRIICECAWVTLAFPLEKSSLVVGVTASPIWSGRYVKFLV